MRLAALAVCLATALPLGAQFEVETVEFRIVSWVGPEVARQAATRLADVAKLYDRLGYRRRRPELPLTVLLLPGLPDLAPYLDAGRRVDKSRGLSFLGDDRAYIAVAWAAPGSPWTALAHEYAHLVDPERDGSAWFREGFAEYLSLLRVDAEGEIAAAAAPHHAVSLAGDAWIPWNALLGADRRRAGFSSPKFYAQSWLLVDWLVAQGASPKRLREEALLERFRGIEPAAADLQLRAHAAQEALLEADVEPAPEPADLPARPLAAWEGRLERAELDRALQRWQPAAAELASLAEERPREPRIHAALGALRMDTGRYAEAEELLARAVRSLDAAWRTHYRYALLLLREGAGEPLLRAEIAAIHAERALEPSRGDPNVRLTLAQALMVAERWNAAARVLRELATNPGWRPRAEAEYDELLRRRRQAVLAIPRPQPAAAEPDLAAVSGAFVEIPLPRPPAPEPIWPPRGTQVISGRIAAVDCYDGQKIVVLHNALFSLRFREPPGKPAKLIHPPMKQWKTLPCGTYGWSVYIAYRPHERSDGTRGELAAVLF